MRVARTIFWILLAMALAVFAVANWLPVEVRIGGGLVLETKLPVLVIGAFLLGLVPTWAILRMALWRLERRTGVLAGDRQDTGLGRGQETYSGAAEQRPLAS